jgi:hypothetical protein
MGMAMTADASERILREQIADAREALMTEARDDPQHWWAPYELKITARNGWSSAVMGLALRQLVADGALEQRRDFFVRVAS